MWKNSNSGPGMNAYRAPSLFQPHRVRQAIRDAHEGKIKPLSGLYFGLSSLPTARFCAPMGFDWAWVDWEHSSCNVETMTNMVHELIFMSEGRTMPFVRVPGHEHSAVGYALDAGASLVIPQVETVEECIHVLSAAKFGTAQNGTRSAPPFRLIPGLTDAPIDPMRSIFKNLNDQAAVMIQIETLAGIHNLDAILTECPDVDAVWLGSLDARVSMNMDFNFFGADEGDAWLEALDVFNRTIEKHDKPLAGFALGPPEVMAMMAKGKCMNIVASDVIALVGMSEQMEISRSWGPLENKGKVAGVVTNGDAGVNGKLDKDNELKASEVQVVNKMP